MTIAANEHKMNLKMLLLLSLGHFVTDINQGGIPVLLPLIKMAFNLSYTASGAIVMVNTITSSIVQPIFGYFSDRWGGIWLLPTGVALACSGFALVGILPNYASLLLAVLASGLGVAAYHPEGFKIAQFFTGPRKATGMSFFMFGGTFGFAAAPLLAVYTYSWLGLKGTLLFLLPGLAMSALLIFELPRLQSRPTIKDTTTSTEDLPKQKRSVKRWISLTFLILAVSVRAWARMGLVTFIPFYFVNILAGNPILVGKLLTVFLSAGAAGNLIGAAIADRIGQRKFFLISLGLVIPPIWLLLQLKSVLLFFGLALVGALLSSSSSVTIIMAQRILPEKIGMASGLITGLSIGAGGIGAAVLGMIADHWGVITVFRAIPLLPSLALLFAMFIDYPPQLQGPPKPSAS